MVRERDYTIDENGLYVFTREYLLRRGYCCLSGCRNCPWDHKPEYDGRQNSQSSQ